MRWHSCCAPHILTGREVAFLLCLQETMVRSRAEMEERYEVALNNSKAFVDCSKQAFEATRERSVCVYAPLDHLHALRVRSSSSLCVCYYSLCKHFSKQALKIICEGQVCIDSLFVSLHAFPVSDYLFSVSAPQTAASRHSRSYAEGEHALSLLMHACL